MEIRKEVIGSGRTTRTDEQWVSPSFTKVHGLVGDGAMWGRERSVEDVAAAVEEVLAREKVESGDAGLRQEGLRMVMATVWRCGAMMCVVPGTRYPLDPMVSGRGEHTSTAGMS